MPEKGSFNLRLNFESKVTLDKYGFPNSFLFGEEMITIVRVNRSRTELRPKVNKTEMDVLTHKGKFRLIRDDILNKWIVLDKLKE